jgi:GT2 family glycosyltransferase
MSQNYISHLLVVKKVLLDEVGVFREGYEGAQDYDLILRLSESLNENEITHIDQILYHWRACEGSTALNVNEKEYTSEAGLNALKSHLSNKKYQTQVDKGMLPNTFKVSYPIEKEPLVSLIIPTRDGYDILSLCIQSILDNTCYRNYEIVIVDNQTTDLQTLAYFKSLTEKYSHIRILKYNKPFNFSAINNFAVSQVKGEVIGLINNDVEIITSSWLKEMVGHALRPEIGAVGAKLYYDNDTIQHAGIILGIGGVAGHSHKYFTKDAHGYFSRLKIIQNLSAVTAAALVVKKSLYMEVGGLDEEHLKVAFNDVDFCLKLQAKGYRNLWTPYVELYHHESVSRGAEDTEEKKIRFEKEVHFMKKKWGNTLKRDRYYNRHLTLKDEKFGIHGTLSYKE